MTTEGGISRRRLAGAVPLLAASTSLGVVAGAMAAPAAHSAGHLGALSRSLKGRLIVPGEMGYAMAAAPNNARYADTLPVAIAVCADEADVQLCVKWARDQRQEFAIRSGGHNYAGFSTTQGLLIDVKAMNRMSIDHSSGTVRLQAGVNNQNMADALRSTPFAVPSGRCPTVGASGLVLGGGWGFAATHAGLTCDSLVQTDIVLADASLVTANAAGATSDLFWALRGGGGGNFGANTSFTFKLHDVSRPVTIFNIVWAGEKQAELLLALQKLQTDFARQISTRTKAYPDAPGALPRREQIRVATLGQFFGPMKDALEALAPVLALSKPIARDIREMAYWQARDYLITDDPNGMYDLRSAYVAEAMSAQGIETMLNWMTRWPGGSMTPENIGIFFAIGGKTRDVAPADTAYVHRNANYIFQIEAAWAPIDKPDVVARQQAWLAAYFADMQPFVLPQSYVNFPNRDQPNWARAYYGSNLERLSIVKRKYDPDNLFRFAQSIPPA